MKTKLLQIRLTPAQYDSINKKMDQLGLTTPRTRCRYLRYLLTNEEALPIASDDRYQELIQAFADQVRIGGLLNQIAHHINRSYIELYHTDGSEKIFVDAANLHAKLKELERGQQALRPHIIALARRGRC